MKSIALSLACMFALLGCAPTYGYGYNRDYHYHTGWDRPTHTYHHYR
jgi:hypothetical protein